MKTPRPLPAPLGLAPFTLQEALDAGASRRRLRHRSLDVPSRGIRLPSKPSAALDLQARPLTLVTQFSAASHATAFLIWDFPGFLPGSSAPGIHISRPDTMAIPRRRGVIGHVGQFFDDEITRLDGVLVTTRTRTWLDCARKMSIDELTVVADHLLRHPRPAFENRSAPYASPEQLAEMLDRHRGTPGIRKARLALEQARIGADSGPETRLRLALGRAGLPEPTLNAVTVLGSGIVREPDMAYPEHRVAVEYEGAVHSAAAQIVRDIAREEDFNGAGWILVRISKRHMENDARAAVAKVLTALAGRGWQPN
ncbi:hypothetical protein QK292_02510 [Arthrobacter sp. AL08]|nr:MULTISPECIES: hypothetical protein [unclassified Arthrobacter]MCB5283401.1 hypothetical protein [Arthrobacter sp. ES1]MDI3240439.1 hypothetical protein [Arthrobacter sp. AL05]MDI3276449.1 hypothetical protein [Arthrobacter sp. AL08]WGZ80159.1 hypothetical protein QI450_02670 [Arthrobacter sp. EM1]